MIYSLNGTLLLIENSFIVIECSGVGYKCMSSMYTQSKLNEKIGQTVMVYTLMNVRQDAVDLFGFAEKAELECFKLLTAVSGVGPKAALSILSSFPPAQISRFVSFGDAKSLTEASGIGIKTAQRIVLELKDKILKISPQIENLPNQSFKFSVSSANIQEAKRALAVLGYSEQDILPCLSDEDKDLPVEKLIEKVLKCMSKGV